MGSHQSTPNQLEDKPFDEPVEWAVFTEKIVEVSAGVKRNVVRWTPKGKEMKGIALMCHGLHEHSLRYFKIANALTHKGYLVASIDHKGHGLSDGEKGLIDDWTALERDFTAYANSLHTEHPDAPFFILAHSLGTVIATLSIKNLPFVKAFAFTGCAMDPGPGSVSPFGIDLLFPITQTPLALPITFALATVSHNGPLSPLVVEEQTTDEHERQLIFKDARRYSGYIMNKSGYEILQMIAASKEAAKAIKTPFMCLHGADDKICLVTGSEYFMNNTATSEDKKTLVIMPGLKHDVLHEAEPHRSEAIDKVVEFFERHCSP